MSVVIRGMKMPKSCYVCPANYDSIECSLVHGIELRGKDGELLYIAERHADCPLIELPPHGRLIDADALCEGRVANDNVVICAKTAPTIIE